MMLKKNYPCSHAMLETVYTHLLPQRGHTVTWIMPSGDSRRIRDWDLVSWNGTIVYLLEGDKHRKNIPKLIGRFTRQYKAVRYILQNEKVDILQVRNDWISGLIGVFAQKRWGIPFVYQVSYPVPEAMRASGGWRKLLGMFAKQTERVLLREAALVLPISRWMQQRFEIGGVPAGKMMEFPLGADTSVRPEEIDGQEVRQRLGIEGHPIVIYFGAMDRIRQLDFLLRAVARLARAMPEVRLLLVGDSEKQADLEWLMSLPKVLGISENVIFTGRVPRTEVPKYIAAADLSVSPIVPLSIYLISSPTKLVESMAMAKPVVANDIPEQKHILAQSGAGICTGYDEEQFAEAMKWLLQHPIEAREMGTRGRRFIEEQRSFDVLARKIEQAYSKLVTQSP